MEEYRIAYKIERLLIDEDKKVINGKIYINGVRGKDLNKAVDLLNCKRDFPYMLTIQDGIDAVEFYKDISKYYKYPNTGLLFP